jgi:electron transport complex protein RnfB
MVRSGRRSCFKNWRSSLLKSRPPLQVAHDPYKQLANHLDQLPGGFPATQSGVELRILKRLFTPEEAWFATFVTSLPEPPRVISFRAGVTLSKAENLLDTLSQKGCLLRMTPDAVLESNLPFMPQVLKRPLLFGTLKKREKTLYQACNFVIGIWEFHLNDLDRGLVEDMNEYIPHLIKNWVKHPQLRTIPIGASITVDRPPLPYDNAQAIILQQDRIAIAECICRKESAMAGHGVCKHDMETCFVFGVGADYYVENKLGRPIGHKEALAILKKVEKKGLVLQPSNAKEVVNICCCCGCCCGVLRNIKQMDNPAQYVPSGYMNSLDQETCNGCGVCVKRCPMDALLLVDKKAKLDPSRCIGCGVCVPTCPTKSFTLRKKPEPQLPYLAPDLFSSHLKLAGERGKITALGMAKLIMVSWFDRLRARA